MMTVCVILTSGRSLPADVPPDRASQTQCAGPGCRRLLSGAQLWLDPIP